MVTLFKGILHFCLICFCGKAATISFEVNEISTVPNYSDQVASPEITSETNITGLAEKNCECLNNLGLGIEKELYDDVGDPQHEVKNYSRNSEEDSFKSNDALLNITFDQILPNFFTLLSTREPPQKDEEPLSGENTNEVLSAVDTLKTMLDHNELKNSTNSTGEISNWKCGLNSNLALFKMISKTFFPEEQNALSSLSKDEKIKILDGYFQKVMNCEIFPASTERYCTENGTVKVYIGKWDLEKNKTAKKLSVDVSPSWITEPTNSFLRLTTNRLGKATGSEPKDLLYATTEKATVHTCNKCSKKWSIALSEIENEACTCTTKQPLSTTSEVKATTKDDFDSFTKSDVYLEFIKVLEAFSITTESVPNQQEFTLPNKLHKHLFVNEEMTKKPLRRTTPLDKYCLKHTDMGADLPQTTCDLPKVGTGRTSTTAHPLLETELVTNPSTTESMSDTISPNKSKAHQELVKVFESLILSTANYSKLSDTSTSATTHNLNPSESVTTSSASTEHHLTTHLIQTSTQASEVTHQSSTLHLPLTTVSSDKNTGSPSTKAIETGSLTTVSYQLPSPTVSLEKNTRPSSTEMSAKEINTLTTAGSHSKVDSVSDKSSVSTTSVKAESNSKETTVKIGSTTELRSSSTSPASVMPTTISTINVSSTLKPYFLSTPHEKWLYQTTNIYELKKPYVITTPSTKFNKTHVIDPLKATTITNKVSNNDNTAPPFSNPTKEIKVLDQSTSPLPPIISQHSNATAVRLEGTNKTSATTKGPASTTPAHHQDSTTLKMTTLHESQGSKENTTSTERLPVENKPELNANSTERHSESIAKPTPNNTYPLTTPESVTTPKKTQQDEETKLVSKDMVSSTTTANIGSSNTPKINSATSSVPQISESHQTVAATTERIYTVVPMATTSATTLHLQVKPPSKITSSPFKDIYDSQTQPSFPSTKSFDECYSAMFKPSTIPYFKKSHVKEDKVTEKSKKIQENEPKGPSTHIFSDTVTISSTPNYEYITATTVVDEPLLENKSETTVQSNESSSVTSATGVTTEPGSASTTLTYETNDGENANETTTASIVIDITITESKIDEAVTTSESQAVTVEEIHPAKSPGEPNILEFPGAGTSTSFDFYGLEPYNSSITVRQYVSDISEKTAAINNRNMIAQWNHETNITHKNYKIAMVSTLELIHYQRIQNQFLDTLRDVPVYDPMLEREIKLLYLPGMSILPDIKIAVFEEMLYAMDTIFSSASVIAWNNPHYRYHLPEVKRAMTVSNIPEELSYYWTEWRNVTGRKLRRLYEQYVELMNLTAISNGFCDASEMWTRDYETEDFMQLMGCHWEEIRPLYLELHAFVRAKLHKHYGDVTMTNDYSLPIPAHLVGDLWGQSWKQLFNITRPYEKAYDYPTMDIRAKGYTTTKMALYAEAFFSSLGFPSLPESFWKNSILTKQKTEMSCEPTAWDMCDGKDFRIKMCSNGTLQDFFDIHHELTHVEYFIQYKDLSFPFRAGPNPGFHEALAGTILLSVGNPNHLSQVGLAPKYKNHNAEIEINYLLRVALDKVAFLPYSYIVDLWRYKVFKGDIKPNDYNKRWWELRLQYQGIAPPNHRTEEDFDPGCKFHIAGNKPYIQNFLSTILQFQFHEALCRRAGLITPKTPLHNCDISNSLEAGTILRRVMSMGATQHWRVAMNELTGTRQISSKGLVEYFKPLLAWLRKENMKTGQKIGWKNTNNLF